MIGIYKQFYDGASAEQANVSGIQAMFWDVTEPKDGDKPNGKSDVVTTDASGFISLDISDVSALTVGEYGFLMLYKLDATDHEDSLVFAGKVIVSDIVSGVSMYEQLGTAWVRPVEWPALAGNINGVELVQGVFAVEDRSTASNIVAFSAVGAYTVDWGDGSTAENFATGVTAEHSYEFADGDLPAVTSYGYKCAIISITPQVAGTLTAVTLGVQPTGHTHVANQGFLDIQINGEYLTTPDLGSYYMHGNLKQVTIGEHVCTNFSSFFSGLASLESVPLFDTSSVVDTYDMFDSCEMMQIFPDLDLSASLDVGYMFAYCYAMKSAPKLTLNTTSVYNAGWMFSYCYGMVDMPLLDFSKAGNCYELFDNCPSMSTYPPFNFTSITTGFGMFKQNYALETMPMMTFNTTPGSYDLYELFFECWNLKYVPDWNTIGCNDFGELFYECVSLKAIPAFDFSNGEVFYAAFLGCYALVSSPPMDLSGIPPGYYIGDLFSYAGSLADVGFITFPSATAWSCGGMFENCRSLRKLPAGMDFSQCTSISYMFNKCYYLEEYPDWDLSAVTSTIGNYHLFRCYSLQGFKSGFVPPIITWTVADCNLGQVELDALYTSLAVVTSKTLTVTGNPGVGTDDPSIATAKGWTITG